MFHRVLPAHCIGRQNAYAQRGTLITVSYFSALLSEINQRGYEVITFRDYLKTVGQHEVQSTYACLTFDDGYADNFLHAKPVLDQFGYPASFYPTLKPILNRQYLPLDYYYYLTDKNIADEKQRADYIGGEKKRAFMAAFHNDCWAKWLAQQFPGDDDAGLEFAAPLYMTAEQLASLDRDGHEIGSHGITHKPLTALSDEQTERELKDSYEWLKNHFKKPAITLAFPDGKHNRQTEDTAKKTGYSGWLGVEFDPAGSGAYPRVFVHPQKSVQSYFQTGE